MQAQPVLGHAVLSVQVLDLLTVQVNLPLLGVAADQGQTALDHALIAVQVLDPTHPLLQADDADLASSHLLWSAATFMGAGHLLQLL